MSPLKVILSILETSAPVLPPPKYPATPELAIPTDSYIPAVKVALKVVLVSAGNAILSIPEM